MSSKLLNYPAASANPHLSAGASGSTAATRNGTSSHGSAQLNFENLQLDDILCTVCQSVLVEPVFLPCQHRFCRNCLSGTIEKNNLNCPCCRKRFGTWYRNASRVNKLVHEQLWNAIQSQFRDYLDEDGAGRCNGNGSTGGCFLPQSESVIHLSEPGEIRKEYETELQRYRKELIEEKKKELAASEKYIINLYKQEGIIDLVDSSDHLSISSTTSTPEPEKKRKPPQQSRTDAKPDAVHEVDDDEEAGPSGNNQKGNHPPPQPQQPNQNSVISSSSNLQPSRPESAKSQSNGSVISISSTSSASAASSSCISSASSRYSLQKPDTATTKQQNKAQSSNQTSKAATVGSSSNSSNSSSSSSGVLVVKNIFTMAELNKSDLCIKPTKLHRRTSSQAVDDDDDDGDSLRSELNHFKPIIATTPKSCFSSKAIVRVPSVRPEAGQLPLKTECFSPSKSPFKPIDPITPRRSAFSVVNVHLFTPPVTISQTAGKSQKQKSTETSTAKKKNKKKSAAPSAGSSSSSATKKRNGATKKTNGTTPSGTNSRKRKLKFSPQTKAKVKNDNTSKDVPSSNSNSSNNSSGRVTRRSSNRESGRLKDLIVSDQQRREAMIEQERLDFEFAQKLQKKLNRTRGAAMLLASLPMEAPKVVRKHNSAYSLRRQSVAVFPTAVMAPPPPPPPPPTSTTSSIGSEAPSRKRSPPKAETKSVDLPTTNAKKRKQQATITTTTTKADDQPNSGAASTTTLRRSTRIRS